MTGLPWLQWSMITLLCAPYHRRWGSKSGIGLWYKHLYESDDRGSWFCHNKVHLITPKRLCNNLVTSPSPSPPSLAINWQTIFHSTPSYFVSNDWSPLRSPLKTIFLPESFSSTLEKNDFFLITTAFYTNQVFKDQGMGQADHTQQVAESILRFFPGFEAFKLPPPSLSKEVMKNINRNKSQINSEFFSGIEKFKVLLKRTLTPKHSFNDGELVTGEGKGYYCIFVWLSSPVREQLVTSLRFLCIFQTKITGFEEKFRGIS